MARIKPVLGETILVKIGDGASPEVFTHAALINTSRGLSFSTAVEADELVDLANMSAPAQMIRRVRSTDLKIDGAGMLDAAAQKEWLDWAQSGAIKNVKIMQTNSGANGGWTVTGPFVLTSFQITGDRLKSATAQITLEQADTITVTQNT